MKFLITGVNHRTAPVEVRERLCFDAASLPGALTALKGRPGFQEALILSTCNRVEIAVAVALDDACHAGSFFADACRVDSASIEPHLYLFEDRDAIRHLFRVASSLDSMVVGEPQILGQLKAAYAAAKEQGAVGGFLDALLTRAFSVAKRVRSETGIGQNAVSVSYAAVELAKEIFGSLQDKSVLVAGAGKMSESTARNLRRSGAQRIFVTNRTPERAVEMARLFDAQIVDYTRFAHSLADMDIVIASSGAPHYILLKEQMREVIALRRNRPMFLIDIAVPRNIEPSVNEIDNVYLYDIDDLQRVVDGNLSSRREEAVQAEEIVDAEVERMVSRLKSREVAPTITGLQEQLESLRVAELARVRSKLGVLTPQQEEAIDQLTRGLINKIAHGPISELRKQAAHPDGDRLAGAIRKMFRLN